MVFLKTITGGRKNCTRMVLSSFFLVLYFFGGAASDLVHTLGHVSELHAVEHGDVQEKDPCHQTIYHKDSRKGCPHKAHIVLKEHCHRCLCTVHHHDQALPSLSIIEFFQHVSAKFSGYAPEAAGAVPLILPARAPPALS